MEEAPAVPDERAHLFQRLERIWRDLERGLHAYLTAWRAAGEALAFAGVT